MLLVLCCVRTVQMLHVLVKAHALHVLVSQAEDAPHTSGAWWRHARQALGCFGEVLEMIRVDDGEFVHDTGNRNVTFASSVSLAVRLWLLRGLMPPRCYDPAKATFQ